MVFELLRPCRSTAHDFKLAHVRQSVLPFEKSEANLEGIFKTEGVINWLEHLLVSP
jgi:hypothetical protein